MKKKLCPWKFNEFSTLHSRAFENKNRKEAEKVE